MDKELNFYHGTVCKRGTGDNLTFPIVPGATNKDCYYDNYLYRMKDHPFILISINLYSELMGGGPNPRYSFRRGYPRILFLVHPFAEKFPEEDEEGGGPMFYLGKGRIASDYRDIRGPIPTVEFVFRVICFPRKEMLLQNARFCIDSWYRDQGFEKCTMERLVHGTYLLEDCKVLLNPDQELLAKKFKEASDQVIKGEKENLLWLRAECPEHFDAKFKEGMRRLEKYHLETTEKGEKKFVHFEIRWV